MTRTTQPLNCARIRLSFAFIKFRVSYLESRQLHIKSLDAEIVQPIKRGIDRRLKALSRFSSNGCKPSSGLHTTDQIKQLGTRTAVYSASQKLSDFYIDTCWVTQNFSDYQ